MNSIAIITIVVVALLTIIIFVLAWLGYGSCLKSYKIEVEQGKHDDTILKENRLKKNKPGLIGIIGSYLALSILAGLFITGAVYRARGENLAINDKTALVIKSGSMSGYYDSERVEELEAYPAYHFDVGDICIFEKVSADDELKVGEVYGYKYRNIIITHRLIDDAGELYKFQGDNNFSPDPYHLKKDAIIYHYTGNKAQGIGAFILYAQSYFGMWSLLGIVGVAISSEVVYYKINKTNKDRLKLICKPEEMPVRSVKAQFKRRDGTTVTIYDKKTGGNIDEK